jgi:hypothetical protein
MKKFFFLALALFFVLPASGQPDTLTAPQKNNQFTIDASHWTRGELRKGGLSNKKNNGMAIFVMSSTMLQFDYQYKNLEFMFAPKHVGIWGAKGSGAIILEEGWFSLRHEKTGLFFKLGRQKFAYDDQRIIGSDDWVMVPSKHDALKAGWERGRHKLHFLFAYNQNDVDAEGGSYYVDGDQPYKTMQTLWYHVDPIPQLGVSALFMNTGMQDLAKPDDDITQYQQLYGLYVDFHPQNFSFQASYYRQMGRNEYELPIHAWMASAEGAWQMNSQLRLNTGYFHMSGDPRFYVPPEGEIGVARKTEVRGFNPIFGSHHQFYGAMDFFYVTTYYGGNTPGLQDAHLGVQWNPVKPLQINAVYHYLATSVAIQLSECGRSLGHEIETSLSWDFTKFVSLQAGYSYMKGTETMKILKRTSNENNTHLHWGWIMLSVTPEFFKIKW